MTAPTYRTLDLFAGAGGLTAGFHQASSRFVTAGAVEMDKAAAASFEATFGGGLVWADSIQSWLESGELSADVDVVIGGPPCQGFSTLGKRDAEDVRNLLWQQYAETIRRVTPKYFVVENVAAFAKSPQFGDFQSAVTSGGELSDYDFAWAVLNAADFGAPQARKRAVLIGHRRDLPPPGLPQPTHGGRHVTVREALRSIPFETVHPEALPRPVYEFEGHQFAGPYLAKDLHVGRNYTDVSLKRFAAIPVGGNRFDLPFELQAECWRRHKSGSADVMGRLHWDRPAVTIRTEFFKPEKGRYLHPEADRAITHYEAALLQGFPPEHRFVGSLTAIARQIGNAVPIPLGSAIATHLLSALDAGASSPVREDARAA
ncbi:DNA cytosine methyltransferase [Lysobacter korlensis]|uniref:Cytosine-specific methyltransferase n=1 Tax=Lysobacter korlensis TaxID=553636 RepID=A0ABV6S0V0_9GAMM